MRLIVAAFAATFAIGAPADERSYPQDVLEVSAYPDVDPLGIRARSTVRADGCEGLLEVHFQYEADGPWRHDLSTYFGFDALDITSFGRLGNTGGFISCDIPTPESEENRMQLLRKKLLAEISGSGEQPDREMLFRQRLLVAIQEGRAGHFYQRNHTITHLPVGGLPSEPIGFFLPVEAEDIEPALDTLREHREQHCPLQG